MSTTWLPCGVYHQDYHQDHRWWQTKFIKGKMIKLRNCVAGGGIGIRRKGGSGRGNRAVLKGGSQN